MHYNFKKNDIYRFMSKILKFVSTRTHAIKNSIKFYLSI